MGKVIASLPQAKPLPTEAFITISRAKTTGQHRCTVRFMNGEDAPFDRADWKAAGTDDILLFSSSAGCVKNHGSKNPHFALAPSKLGLSVKDKMLNGYKVKVEETSMGLRLVGALKAIKEAPLRPVKESGSGIEPEQTSMGLSKEAMLLNAINDANRLADELGYKFKEVDGQIVLVLKV